MTEGRRAGDGGWRSLVRENWYRDVWLIVVTVLVAASLWTYGRESQARRDGACTLFERGDHTAKEQLAQTYSYLAGLRPRERRDSLNRAVLAQLPAVEAAARAVTAPPYCAPRDVGLSLPPARMPVRPKGVPAAPMPTP
jgi:hypothetical protein